MVALDLPAVSKVFMPSSRIAAALPLIFAASVASAADLPYRSPAPAPILTAAPVASWEGFYAGSIFGAGYGQFKSSQTASRSFHKVGQTGGGLLGYNFQSGPFVYGLEGDITLDVIRGHNAGAVGLIAHDADTLWTARMRGRLGYDLGAFLPFVAGGVAFNESYVYNGAGAVDFGQNRRQTGYTLGAGIDWKFLAPILGPIALRAEYVYDGYPGQTYTSGVGVGTNIRVKNSTQYFRIALISRFGDNWRPPANDTVVADWSGAYAGLIGGGMWTKATTTAPGGASSSLSASGAAGGLYAGRNFQFGSYVLGFDSSSMLTSITGNGSLPGGAAGSLSYRNYIEATLRGRVGYAVGRYLPFFAAGVSFGRSEQRDPTTGSQRGRIPTEAWTVGAGLDYMLTDRFSVRGEYLYARDFSNRDTALNATAYTQKHSSQMLRVGLAYHFH
jgi:outer membrane immunogenic protein